MKSNRKKIIKKRQMCVIILQVFFSSFSLCFNA